MFNMISSVPKPYAESISDTSVDRDEVSDKE